MSGLLFGRTFVVVTRLAGDANIRPGHPAERASWIWSDKCDGAQASFVLFRIRFPWLGGKLRLHVTADNRYQLSIDGVQVSYGPDRSDPEHWSVATIEVDLVVGDHELQVLAWHLPDTRLPSSSQPTGPMAQMSCGPGFLLAADNAEPDLLDTGTARWECADLTEAVQLTAPSGLDYHDIGPAFHVDVAAWRKAFDQWSPVVIAALPPAYNIHGVRSPGRTLASTPLPEQRREIVRTGRIRAARPCRDDAEPWMEAGPVADWCGLLDEGRPVEVSPDTSVEFLWDVGYYVCGYPSLAWSGGRGARIEFAWAESLYDVAEGQMVEPSSPKGDRSVVKGRRWLGFEDAFTASGASNEEPPALWWRSGRFIRVRLRTAAEPLRLERLAILNTGYPLSRAWQWTSSDAAWDSVLPLLGRGLELCAHETWVDCPFFEQMMYVGDTRLMALANYAGYADDRLSRRAIELFGWSRNGSAVGLVAERYPSAWRQESTSYAMIWPLMVRDFMLWRDDPTFVRSLLPAVRQLVEALLALRSPHGLLGAVPGWPFVDWVPVWNQGCGPGVCEGDSSILNLQLVLALQAAAEVEAAVGEAAQARRFSRLARSVMDATVQRYWSESQGAMLDSRDEGHPLSEHAQCLALITGSLDRRRARACRSILETGSATARCTIYFTHYLLEALSMEQSEEAFFRRLDFWRELPALGFTSLPERPDPCRSDCHGWGAHPLYHSLASIAGVRPASPFFKSLEVRPMPGPLTRWESEVVHPRGTVRVLYERRGTQEHHEIEAPSGVSCTLIRGRRQWSFEGKLSITIPSPRRLS